MKPSINKIFKNLNLFLLTTLILSSISFLFLVEQSYSYEKFEILKHQKEIFLDIDTEKQKSTRINIIQFNANISTLNNEVQSLINQDKYNYISKYINQNSNEYLSDLEELIGLTNTYNLKLRNYFNLGENDLQKAEESEELGNLHNTIIIQIDMLIFKNINYDKNRFDILIKFFVVLLLLLFVMTLWYKKRLSRISKDILFLYAIDSDKDNKVIFSQEAEAINLKMKRKSLISDNPNMMDAVTEIYNNKGMLQAYSKRKSLSNQNFSCIAILEMDNFSKSKRTFTQEFTQDILKKTAYTISLYEQATDIVARSDYNQFTLIISRASQDQLFKDVDLIRQSISELNFISPEKKTITITVTGSFIMKSQNSSLEESVRKAKELLENAKKIGRNIIIQPKDIPK